MSETDIVDAEVIEDDDGQDEPTVAALVPQQHSDSRLLTPAASLDAIGDAFEQYQGLRERILTDDDYQSTYGGNSFLKRSGWRKLSTAFSVDYEIMDREVVRNDAGVPVYAEFVIRATAPNGRKVDGWGSCSVYERCCEPDCSKGGRHRHCDGQNGYRGHEDAWTHFSKPDHDIPATAETRAKNRAAADLFGMGEVSAEEVQEGGGGGGTNNRQHEPSGPQAVPDRNRAVGATDKQRNFIKVLQQQNDIPDDEYRMILKSRGVESSRDENLTKDKASGLIEVLQDDGKREALREWARKRLDADEIAAEEGGEG